MRTIPDFEHARDILALVAQLVSRRSARNKGVQFYASNYPGMGSAQRGLIAEEKTATAY